MGLIRSSLVASEGMGRVFSDLVSVYSSSAKAGVCHPLPGLEGYLVPSCTLTRRLIKTIRMTLPSYLTQLIDRIGNNIGPHELLFVIVHKRDFVPPRVSKPPPLSSSSSAPPVRPFDPRSRGQTVEESQRPYDPRARVAVPPPPPPPPASAPPVPPAPPPPAPIMSLSGLGALAAALGVVKPDQRPPSPPRPPPLPSFDLSSLGALAVAVGFKSQPSLPPPPPPLFPSVNPSPMTRSAPYGPYSEDYDRDFIHAMAMYQGYP